MISFKEILGKYTIDDLTANQEWNIEDLVKRVNIIREAWGKPMQVTSGFRTPMDQIRIYSAKGIAADKIPMGSAHLRGQAVDIYDPTLQLTEWLKSDKTGITKLEEAGLYCEDGNSNWVHFQSCSPASGRRWFKP